MKITSATSKKRYNNVIIVVFVTRVNAGNFELSFVTIVGLCQQMAL